MQDTSTLTPTPTEKYRFNLRAAIVLLVVITSMAAGTVALYFRQASRVHDGAIATARRLAKEGQVDLAVRNLDAILQSHPDDPEALELKGILLAERAQSVEHLLGAAFVNDQFVRANPKAPGIQEARRRTADLFIRYSNLYQESSFYRNSPESTVFNMRYRAAAAHAEQLIREGAKDADAYRLRARAREGLARTGDAAMLKPAEEDYRAVLGLAPGDVIAAERLANLLNDRGHDPSGALKVLDELAINRPNSPEVCLARHRFFNRVGRDDRAQSELEAALRLVPDDLSTCLAAAEVELRHGRTAEARRFLARIRPEFRESLRVRLVLGLIDLNENHPEEAMEGWRKGLISSQGSDAMLTWNLAFSLLQLGRLAEARPLVAQYRRLMNDDSSAMLNLLEAIDEQKQGHSFRAAIRLEGLRGRIDARWMQLLDFTLGQCYVESDDPARATIAFRRVLHENPRMIPVRVALAESLMKTRPHEAADILEEGLKSVPDSPALWVALASARLAQQEKLEPSARSWASFDRAMARAAELAPGHPAFTLLRSGRQALGGNTTGATALLEEAIRREPRNLKLWENLAETLLKAGRSAEALKVLERASTPEGVGDTVGLRLHRARVLAGLGRAREARELLARDLDKIAPDQRTLIWDALGRDLVARGDRPGALEVYRDWAKRAPEDARPRLALLDLALYGGEAEGRTAAEALGGLGARDDATGRLNRARELIRAKATDAVAAKEDDARLREAGRLLDAVRLEAPQLAALDTLHGELLERRELFADAIQAYRRSWGKGCEEILPHLIDLLARTRPGDLEQLTSLNGSPRVLQLAVQASLRVGQPERAARIAAKDPGESLPAESLAWRVEQLERLGASRRAEALLKAETIRRPDAAEPWLALLRSQAKQGRAEAVALTIDEARKSIKDERPELVEARLCWAAGDRSGADRAFEAALASRPDDLEILLAASDYDQEVGRPDRAEAHLRRVLAINPNHRPASRKLALLLSARPMDEAAWGRAWAALGPETPGMADPEERLLRAVLLANGPGADRRRRAVDLLQALVADLPHDTRAASRARGLLARLLLDDGQAERVTRLLGPWAESGVDPAEVALHARALLQAGQLVDAGRQLDRLATLAPGDDQEGRLRARLARARSRPEEVASALERDFLALGRSPTARSFGREAFALLLATKPPAVDAADRVGRTLASWDPGLSWMPAMVAARRGRMAEALRLCRVAADTAEAADAREVGRVAFGAAFSDPGVDHLAELEAILEAAARRDPGGTDLTLQMAQLRHRQGRFDDVVRLYREVIGRRPDLRPSIQNNIAWVLSEDLHRPEDAIKLADELLQSQGRTADVLDTRGVILTRLRRFQDATLDLEDSIRINPNPVHLFHLARAYRDAGRAQDFQRCRETLRRAGLNPNQVSPSERAELASLMQP